MATLFKKNLTANGDALLIRRGDLVEQAAIQSIDMKISEIKAKINGLEREEAALTDLGPDTSIDLKPGKDFNADAWSEELFRIQKEIMLREIDLGIYMKIKEKYLLDSESETTS